MTHSNGDLKEGSFSSPEAGEWGSFLGDKPKGMPCEEDGHSISGVIDKAEGEDEGGQSSAVSSSVKFWSPLLLENMSSCDISVCVMSVCDTLKQISEIQY